MPSMLTNATELGVAEWTEGRLLDLATRHLRGPIGAIIDVGFSDDLAVELRWRLGAEKLFVTHPDDDRIKRLKLDNLGASVDAWLTASPLELLALDIQADIVLLVDVLHEVYSTDGRPGGDFDRPIHHDLGVAYVRRALEEAHAVLRPGGAVILATDLLASRNASGPLTPKTPEAANFLARSGVAVGQEVSLDRMAVLLGQFESGDHRHVRAFLSLEEWRVLLHDIGFDLRIEVGTPEAVWSHRREHFEASTLPFPEKRLAALAIKR